MMEVPNNPKECWIVWHPIKVSPRNGPYLGYSEDDAWEEAHNDGLIRDREKLQFAGWHCSKVEV